MAEAPGSRKRGGGNLASLATFSPGHWAPGCLHSRLFSSKLPGFVSRAARGLGGCQTLMAAWKSFGGGWLPELGGKGVSCLFAVTLRSSLKRYPRSDRRTVACLAPRAICRAPTPYGQALVPRRGLLVLPGCALTPSPQFLGARCGFVPHDI